MKKDGQKHKNNTGKSFRGPKPPRKKRYDGPKKPPMGKRVNANIWGMHAVTEAWLNPDREIKALHISEKALGSFQNIIEQAKEEGLSRPSPNVIEKSQLDRLGSNVVHQGIAIDAEPLPEVQVQDLISLTYGLETAVILVLDQVTDPHNVGAIIRSAAAFGVSGIILQRRHSPELTGILAKTACGGVDHVPVAYETNLSKAVDVLQQEGFKAIGLDEHADDISTRNFAKKRTVLLLGSEGKGLRPKLKDQCDALVKLPTQGAIQSLNVSNAAAIALYAVKASSN